MLLNYAVQTLRAILSGHLYGRILALAILTWVGNPPVSLAATLPVSESPAAEQRMKEGLRLLQQGDFAQATSSWREAARLYEAEQKFSQQSSALIHLAQAYQALGQYRDAVQNLESALALAEKSNDRAQVAIALGTLGNVYLATGPAETARKYLDEGLRLARELKNQDISAIILNNLGNLLTRQKKYTEALAAYKDSLSLASARNNHALVTTALINAATASTNINQHKEAKALLDKALDQMRALEPSHDKAAGLVNIGLAYFDLRSNLPDVKDSLLLLAHQTLGEAGTTAESIGDRRTASYAWGHLGRLYEEEHR